MRYILVSIILPMVLALASSCGTSSDQQPAPDQDLQADLGSGDTLATELPASDLPHDAQGDGLDQDADGDALDHDAEQPVEVEIEVETLQNPFRLVFTHKGRTLLSLGGAGKGALGLLHPQGERSMLETPVATTQDGQTTTFQFELADGRSASVTLRPRPHGAMEVAMRIDDMLPKERLLANLVVTPEEGFSGIMERVVQGAQDASWSPNTTEALNLRGQAFQLEVLPTIALYSPFFVSTAGYGIYVDSHWPGKYDFGKSDPDVVALNYEGPELVFQVFPGQTPMEVVERFSLATGTTTMPPKWALGHYRWRDDHYDLPYFYDGTPYDGPFNSMVAEDILMMEAFGIPTTVYWVDRPWGPGSFGYDDFKYDENRLPNPQAMINWLSDKGIKFMLWICPWAVGEMATEAVEKGYVYQNPNPLAGPPEAKMLDLTNPEARTWWQDAMIPLIKDGVAGFKLDRGEEKNPDGKLFTGTVHDGRDYREMHNAYVALYAKTVREAFERAGVPDGVVMPRAGWRTTSHYATPWGGDTAPTQHGLRSAIIAQQRCATMNYPIWGSDTCGYGGTAPQEVCSRWLGFSAFSPIMEVGPTDNVAFWSWPEDGVDAKVNWDGYHFEPQYNEQLIAEYILYANIHMDLLDYIYAQALKAHTDGTPIIRPMFFLKPGDAAYMEAWDQYLFGPDILVAPVWQTGQYQREVLIPEGNWVDAWSAELHVGPTTITVDAPEHKIPFFLRQESGIALGDLETRWVDAQETAAQKPDLSELQKSLPTIR